MMIGWVQFRRRGFYCRRLQYIIVVVIRKDGGRFRFDFGFCQVGKFKNKDSDCLVKVPGVFVCNNDEEMNNFWKVIDEDLSPDMIVELELKFDADFTALKNK